MKRKMYHSAWFLLQSNKCPQFTLADKYACLEKLHKPKELFEVLFGNNKDIINNRTDLAESITKLSKLGNKGLESKILTQLHKDFSTELKYDFALKSAEVNGDYEKAIEGLYLSSQIDSSAKDGLQKLSSKFSNEFSKDNIKLMEIIDFGKNLDISSKVKDTQMSFKDDSRSPWDLEIDFGEKFNKDDTGETTIGFDSDISSLNRVALGFEEQGFGYQVNVMKTEDEKEKMPIVMNDNIEHWLGFGSLDIASTQPENVNEMIGEETTNKADDYEDPLDPEEVYDNIEDVKYLMILWRFDQGAGAKILDLSENRNNGQILRDNIILTNEEAAVIWQDGELQSGEPLVFEDEWGKQSPPNWAITFDGTQGLRARGSKNLAKLKGHFTFQVWLKIDEFSEFTLFKRQAEDFNVKFKEPNLIQVSREHNIRNIIGFNLEEELKAETWTNITIVYRQIQTDEHENDNCGIKIFMNAQLIYEDSKLNFKKPLKETDGFIFLQDYKGQFTELRFWNINLSRNIIQETLKRPLDCVNDLRKRVQMDDDEFTMMSKQKRARGKRATLVAPTGKSFGFGGGLKRPPRSSVKITQREIVTLATGRAEEIKEESDNSDKRSESEQSEEDETVKDTQDQDSPKMSESEEATEEQKSFGKESPKNKPEIKQDDDFAFDFDNKPKEETQKTAEDFGWDEDFSPSKKEESKQPESFDDFSWDEKPTTKAEKPTDDFAWDEDSETKPANKTESKDEFWDASKPQNKEKEDDEWDFGSPTKAEEKHEAELNLSQEQVSEKDSENEAQENKETEEQKSTENKLEGEEFEQEEFAETEQVDTVNHPKSAKAEDEAQDENSHLDSEQEPEENVEVKEEVPDTEEKENFVDEKVHDDEEKEHEDEEKEHEDEEKVPEEIHLNKSDEKSEEKLSATDEKVSPRDQPEETDRQVEAVSENEVEDEKQVVPSPKVEKKANDFDEFDFSNTAPKKTQKETDAFDDFNFDAPAPKKNKDDDFDFDFGSKPQNKAADTKQQDDEFDFDFGGGSQKPKQAQNDDFGFDDFAPKETKQEPKKGNPEENTEIREKTKNEEKEKEPTENIEEEKEVEVPKLKSQSSSEHTPKPRRFSSSSRKCSLEVQEFTEETNAFMEECVKIIQEDIIKEDFENALITVESNMNELIYDYKELERNKDQEEEEDFKLKIKELKANIRFLTFYKLCLKVCHQVTLYKGSQDQADQEMSASLANILVLPPVHEEVKKIFYKMAINENMRCKNYKVALKLIKSYDKQIEYPSEEESNGINITRDQCEALKQESKEKFESVDCPNCGENLPFGHATPSCNGCKSKILFCNETLIPLVPEIALRCYICFATYDRNNLSLFIPDDIHLCPN